MAYLPLETPRLLLRRFREEDLEPFLTYRNQPEVARYQSWIHWSHNQGIEFIREQQQVSPGDLGRWFQYAMELKETGALVGDCGLCIKVAVPKTGEIGFSLAPEHQRKGLATEAVEAIVDHAIRELEVERIIAVAMRDNDRSAELLHRVGLRHGPPERVWFKGAWGEELRFALAGEDWSGRRHI